MKIFKFKYETEKSEVKRSYGLAYCQVVSTGVVIAETKEKALTLLKEEHPIDGEIKSFNEVNMQKEQIIETDEVIDYPINHRM